MANQLRMALVETILSLHRRGLSQRRIAEELGIHRETVARHLDLAPAESKPANAPIGSEETPAESKPANAPIGLSAPLARHGRASECEPWRAAIITMLEQGLSAQRIYQDLTSEHGFTRSYYSVRRFVSKLEEHLELPFRRMECEPGEEAQVDFGTGAPLERPDGRRQRTHVFRIVLSYSRKAYSEVVPRQTTELFLRCLENAFWHFGGVPRRIVLDNLRAAVSKADWYEPELNPKVQSFAAHYGTVFLPTRPRMPRHKGKVERQVGYVQDNGLKGRRFASLEEQNLFLTNWEETIADQRLHGTTRRQVGPLFAEVERATLQPLPVDHFACFQEAQRTVHRDGHVEVARAYYSVPPEYLGRRVWVRWDGRLVRVFNQKLEAITSHAQSEAGRFSTKREHIVSEKINAVERGVAWPLRQIRRIGPQATRWAEGVVETRSIEGVRVLQGLLSLANKHRSAEIERACGIAFSYGSFRLRTLRELIQRHTPPPTEFEFIDQHALIRPLSEYAHCLINPVPEGDAE